RAVLAPTSATGTFPTNGDLGGSKLLYGVLNGTDSVQAGANVEAVGGSTIFAGAYFGAGSYAGGDYSATLTNEAGSGDLLVVVYGQEVKLNGATLASDTGTARFEVLEGGRVTVTGGGFNGNSDIVVTGKYDPVDGSEGNTTGQVIFRVQGNDVLKNGQNIRVDKGVFNTYGTEWPVAPGATATVTIGPLGAMAPMDWGNHDWASDHVRRGTYIFEGSSVLMTNDNTDRLRQSEAKWDISPDAFIALRDNIWTQDIDPVGPGGQYELDNVNWMLGMADQVREIRMGDGRRLTKAWDHNDRLHDNNASIIPSASSAPSSVIFSAPSAGGSLNIDAVVLLGGVDININDQIGTATYYLDHIRNENDLTRTRLAQTGRVEMDGRTIQANNITVRNGFLRLFSNERDVTPTITGDIVVWDDGELEIYFARGEGNDNGPATNAAMVRHQVENDTLLPAGKGLYLDQGSMYRPYYRNFDSSSPVGGNQDEWQQGHTTAVPHVVNQTITVRGTGAVAGGRLSSGDPMTIIRFDEEGGDVNGDNHILFPNIVLEEGAHLGIQRGDVDREELRLGVTLKGNARMERENEEWSFQDVNVETLGQEFTLTVDRDGNGGQYDMYGTVGAGVTLTGVDVHFDFNWGANVEDGAVVANLGNQTPGEPGSDGYIRVFTGSDGNNPITGGTFLVSGNQDMEVIVDDHADTQIVNNFGGTIEFVDNGFGGRAGFVRSRRRVVDLDVAGKVVYANIVIDGAATASIYHDHDTDYNMLRVDTGTGGGNLNAEWGGHDFNLNELTGAGRLHNGIFHVDTTLAPGAGAGTLTVQNLVVEGAANYQMEFDVAATDKVHVDDILTINDGWTLELLSDGGFADPGVEYDVFTWGNSATVANDGSVVLPGTYTLVNTAGWDITSAALNYDAGAKRIYLTGVDGLDDLSWNANDGNWNDGANWSMGSPPVANSVPLVDRTGHIATVANGGQVAFRLTVEAGRVDIDGGDLSITSDVNINGAAAELSVTDGTLNVAGDLNVGGAGGAVTVTANVGLAQQGVANVDNSVNVVANGNLSVSDGGELNTQTLNTAGMTNLIGATGVIGTINITNGTTTIASTAIPQVSATGGVLNTEGQGVENLTVGGTAKVNTTAATTVTDLRMSSGRVLLTGGDLTVTTANLAGGVMNASDNALVVSKKVALSDLNIATSDAQFTLSGADLANDSVARTLTVQGDVTVSSGSMPTSLRFWLDASDVTTLYQDAGGTTPAADGTPVALWKDKSGNGFDVTHDNAGQLPQYDNTTDTLNGLATLRFDGDVLGRANDIGISGNADRTVITVWHDAVATGQNYQHTFHMGNAGTREAYGHSVARTNDGRIGNHYWADGFDSTASSGTSQANIAISTWDGDGGAPGSGLDSWYVNGVFAGTYEIVGGLNTGANDLLLGSRLTPQTEGIRGNIAEVLVFDKVLTADEINNMGGYLRSKWGISAPAWTGGLHFSPTILSTTSVVATESSTLSVTSEPGDPLTLAGIEIAGGKTLIVDSPAIDIQLTNLTLGADSRLKSILTAENTGTSGVAITVGGTLSAGGGSSALGYAGDAEGIGADWYSTSLELTGTATYEWTFTSSTLDVDLDFDAVNDLATGDSVNVFGAVSLADGVEIQLVDGLAPGVTVNGVDVALFWAIEDAVFNLANITVRSPIGAPVEWTWDSVEYVNEEWVVLTNLVTGIHPGDATGDNKVNGEDLVLLNAQWGDRGAVGTLSCDFDNDGDVDIDDFQILNAQWGYDGAGGGGAPEMPGSETPEPATMSLLALGGLLILRRRRKA
ncbi:MAG: PEP-CTERM sorting domain-containing protein, partial [Phycisphaerae bacterium]|nr:PEP-CTERM sorting domain-containing protein [Phycisphaerae bacterium]